MRWNLENLPHASDLVTTGATLLQCSQEQPLACTPVLDDLCKRSLVEDYSSTIGVSGRSLLSTIEFALSSSETILEKGPPNNDAG